MLMNHQIHLEDQIAGSEFAQPLFEFWATWKLAHFRQEIESLILAAWMRS